MDVIIAENLQKLYPNGSGIKSISCKVKKGEFIGVLGPSGAGKTTLMRLLCGAIFPTAGVLEVMGQNLSTINRTGLARLRRQVATIYQNFNVVPSLSVMHNVSLGKLGGESLISTMRSLICPSSREKAEITRILRQLGIEDKVLERCQELSGGEQQRVAVARALISDAPIILADEPIASVDPVTATVILDMFKQLQADGKTLILNLHQVSSAIQYCSRLLVLERGRLAFDGPPELFRLSGAFTQLTGEKRVIQKEGLAYV